MTDTDPKALEHACQCAGREVHHFDRMALDLPLRASIVAHARAIEQHETFRQEVSDAAVEYNEHGAQSGWLGFDRFILPKPDPLVEALNEGCRCANGYDEEDADNLRAALAARGLEIREVNDD